MANFARIIDNVAVDVSFNPAQQFHPDIAAQFAEVSLEVKQGWRFDGDTWSAPVESPAEPAPGITPTYPTVGPIHFQMLFTTQEAVAADAARSADPVLNRFWKLIEDPRTDVVNLALKSVQDAVECTLTVASGAIPDMDIAARKAAILSGQLQ